MDGPYKIIHKKENWLAAMTYSKEGAELWITKFNPALFTDKTLRGTDFKIVEGYNDA